MVVPISSATTRASVSFSLTTVASARRSTTRSDVQQPSRRLMSYRRCAGRIWVATRWVSSRVLLDRCASVPKTRASGAHSVSRARSGSPSPIASYAAGEPIVNRCPSTGSVATSTVPVGRSRATLMNVASTASRSVAARAARPRSSSPTAVTDPAAGPSRRTLATPLDRAPPSLGPSGKRSHNSSPMPRTRPPVRSSIAADYAVMASDDGRLERHVAVSAGSVTAEIREDGELLVTRAGEVVLRGTTPTCVGWRDEEARTATVDLRPDEDGIIIEASADEADQIELSVELSSGRHWYGMGELLHQRWPLEEVALQRSPFLTWDNGISGVGNVLEPVWFSATGIVVWVAPGD